MCVSGEELVTWFVERKHAETREDAVVLGVALCRAMLLYHVAFEHDFKDEAFFYRLAVVQF